MILPYLFNTTRLSKQIKTPEQLFGNDATVEEMRELYNDAVYQDQLKGRLTPEDKEWRSKK